MGDDDKVIRDIIDTANQLRPEFIAVAGTPIPMMMGTDFSAIAAIIEKQTGIPSFGIPTNGMHSYINGADLAFEHLAKRLVDMPDTSRVPDPAHPRINILGVTPLDFSVNGSDKSLKALLENCGFEIISTWAMGSSLEDIRKSAGADVNLVVSCAGLRAARELKRRFNTPYVCGIPIGTDMTNAVAVSIRYAMTSGQNLTAFAARPVRKETDVTIIGETIFSASLAYAITASSGASVQVLCPLETEQDFLCGRDCTAEDETDIIPHLSNTRIIIADPLYRPVCPQTAQFVSLPHEAFSGRIYRNEIPELIAGYPDFQILLNTYLQR